MRLFQGTKMTECSRLPGIRFLLLYPSFLVMSAEYFGYITCYRRLFGYANYHFFSSCFYTNSLQSYMIILTDRIKNEKTSRPSARMEL